MLVEDLEAALPALTRSGLAVSSEQEVVVVALEDPPGALGAVSRQLGDAGVNITLTYLATDTRLVLAADNLAAARTAPPPPRTARPRWPRPLERVVPLPAPTPWSTASVPSSSPLLTEPHLTPLTATATATATGFGF